MDLRIGVFVILGLLMLMHAASIVTTGAAAAGEALYALAMIALSAITMLFAHKRKVTGYKVCVYIYIAVYILALLGCVLILVGGVAGVASLVDPNEEFDEAQLKTAFNVFVGVIVAIMVAYGYFMAMLYRYIGVMVKEVQSKQAAAQVAV
ncbi:hypothetical protein BCR44DRAFT_1427870 [Catenaria anguillulae PL171]|uniref:Uncharacterized protein n=1 Tax=Catenaria anguillulae PL171 TaxID=765915 RepID=A0A1Y2HW58_9FUNG|nr:hypothetical protein BCR44DRAFT_1427870 [Catenaria anguillulae PL171]